MTDTLNALVAFLNFVFIAATAYGTQRALGALGVTLIYGILRFSNFAHAAGLRMRRRVPAYVVAVASLSAGPVAADFRCASHVMIMRDGQQIQGGPALTFVLQGGVPVEVIDEETAERFAVQATVDAVRWRLDDLWFEALLIGPPGRPDAMLLFADDVADARARKAKPLWSASGRCEDIG